MMPFAEKLSFLMHITETSNKELAAELGVDPSLISLMRTGKRKLSKNPAQARKMAAFFARRSSAAFQRQALSELLEQVSISPTMPTEALASSLESWLQGERSITDTFLSGIQAFPEPSQGTPPPPAPTPAAESQTLFFYGEEGRQEAMRRIMQESRRLETPGTIMTVVDDNLEWLLSNYSLTKQVQTWLLNSAERGFTFLQIMPPLNFIKDNPQTYSKSGERIIVSPYILMWNDGNYYLDAYDDKKFRTYRADRMEGISHPLLEKRDGENELCIRSSRNSRYPGEHACKSA